MSSPGIAAAVRVVLADYRAQQDDPNATLAEAITSTREHLDHDDIDTLTRTDELGGPLMTAEVAAATRAVLDAHPDTIAEAIAADGEVEVTDVGIAMATAAEQPVERAGGVETVAVVEHADAAVACAAAAAAAAQAAADAHAAGDLDAVGVVIVEDLRAPCDADAY